MVHYQPHYKGLQRFIKLISRQPQCWADWVLLNSASQLKQKHKFFSFYIGNQPGLAAHPQIKTKYGSKVKNCNWQVDLRQIERKSRQVSW